MVIICLKYFGTSCFKSNILLLLLLYSENYSSFEYKIKNVIQKCCYVTVILFFI